MAEQPARDRWQRRVLLGLALALSTVIITGAKEVTSELRHRPARRDRARAKLHAWNEHLLSEVPGAANRGWQQLAARRPVFILQSCTQRPTRRVHR